MNAEYYIAMRKMICAKHGKDYAARDAALAHVKHTAEQGFQRDYKILLEIICSRMSAKTYTWVIDGNFRDRTKQPKPEIPLADHADFAAMLAPLCGHPLKSAKLSKLRQKISDIRLKLTYFLEIEHPRAKSVSYF